MVNPLITWHERIIWCSLGCNNDNDASAKSIKSSARSITCCYHIAAEFALINIAFMLFHHHRKFCEGHRIKLSQFIIVRRIDLTPLVKPKCIMIWILVVRLSFGYWAKVIASPLSIHSNATNRTEMYPDIFRARSSLHVIQSHTCCAANDSKRYDERDLSAVERAVKRKNFSNKWLF